MDSVNERTNFPVEKIDWKKVEELGYIIANDIKKDNLKIDTLVPILRGGMPLALLLSSMLNVLPMSCIHIRRSIDDTPNTIFKKPVNKGVTNELEIKDKNILVIDDILDSKETLNFAIDELKKYKPKSINVAVLYNFNIDSFNDKEIYSGTKLNESRWIVFPWEEK